MISEIIHSTSPLQNIQVAFFFFDFNDPAKQTVEGMLRCLVFQLAMSVETLPKCLAELYARHHHQDKGFTTQPTVEEWISILTQLLDHNDPFYIVIDALDECQEEETLLDSLEDLITRTARSVRWFFTSQASNTVSSLLKFPDVKCVHIETLAVDKDISTYLEATLENDIKLRSYSAKAKVMIKSEIEDKARGMWVANTARSELSR